jgi:hypothetical protein
MDYALIHDHVTAVSTQWQHSVSIYSKGYIKGVFASFINDSETEITTADELLTAIVANGNIDTDSMLTCDQSKGNFFNGNTPRDTLITDLVDVTDDDLYKSGSYARRKTAKIIANQCLPTEDDNTLYVEAATEGEVTIVFSRSIKEYYDQGYTWMTDSDQSYNPDYDGATSYRIVALADDGVTATLSGKAGYKFNSLVQFHYPIRLFKPVTDVDWRSIAPHVYVGSQLDLEAGGITLMFSGDLTKYSNNTNNLSADELQVMSAGQPIKGWSVSYYGTDPSSTTYYDVSVIYIPVGLLTVGTSTDLTVTLNSAGATAVPYAIGEFVINFSSVYQLNIIGIDQTDTGLSWTVSGDKQQFSYSAEQDFSDGGTSSNVAVTCSYDATNGCSDLSTGTLENKESIVRLFVNDIKTGSTEKIKVAEFQFNPHKFEHRFRFSTVSGATDVLEGILYLQHSIIPSPTNDFRDVISEVRRLGATSANTRLNANGLYLNQTGTAGTYQSPALGIYAPDTSTLNVDFNDYHENQINTVMINFSDYSILDDNVKQE